MPPQTIEPDTRDPGTPGEPRRWATFALALVGIGVTGVLFWRFGTDELLAALSRAHGAPLAVYFLLACVVVLMNAWRWRYLAEALGGNAPLSRYVAARMAGDAVGIALPSARVGGDPVRVAFLYEDGAAASEAFAGVTIDRVVETISNTICTLLYVGVFVVFGPSSALREDALWIVVSMLAAMLAFAVHGGALLRGHAPFRALFGEPPSAPAGFFQRLRSLLVRIEEQVAAILRGHPHRFATALLVAVLTQSVIVLMYQALLGAFGIHLPLPLLLMAFVASGFARAVPTPAGLGAFEAAQVGLLSVTVSAPELGFVVGILMRLHDAIWCGFGVLLLLHRGAGSLRQQAAGGFRG